MAYSVKLFTHDAKTKTFTAFISDVFVRGEFVLPLVLVSDMGSEATFFLMETEKDEEGDTLCWHFEPSPESVEANPRLAGYSLKLFND